MWMAGAAWRGRALGSRDPPLHLHGLLGIQAEAMHKALLVKHEDNVLAPVGNPRVNQKSRVFSAIPVGSLVRALSHVIHRLKGPHRDVFAPYGVAGCLDVLG